MRRSRVYYAGVYRRGADPEQHEARKRDLLRWQEQHKRPHRDKNLSRSDQAAVRKAQRHKAVYRAPRGYPYEIQPCKACRSLRVHSARQHKIAPCPESGCLLQRAVAEEAQHYLLRPADAHDLAQAQGARRLTLMRRLRLFPQRQTDQQDQRQAELDI